MFGTAEPPQPNLASIPTQPPPPVAKPVEEKQPETEVKKQEETPATKAAAPSAVEPQKPVVLPNTSNNEINQIANGPEPIIDMAPKSLEHCEVMLRQDWCTTCVKGEALTRV